LLFGSPSEPCRLISLLSRHGLAGDLHVTNHNWKPQRFEGKIVLTPTRPEKAAPPSVPDSQANLADELAERELAEEMVSYRKDVTGVDHTVFISPKGRTRHGPRINLGFDPPDTVDPRGKTASVAIENAAVVAGDNVPAALLDQVRRFIELNRGSLLDYWEYRIDTDQLRRRLIPITGR
jgi:hypothetical protein